jgi:hypothetical protein
MDRDPSELEAAAHDVRYEIDMLDASHARLLELHQQLKDLTIEQNTFLEAFLIHYRALWDFIESRGHNEDDVKADNYAPDFTPSSVLDQKTRNGINRRLAHLSYTRLDHRERTQDQGWSVDKMRQRLLDVLREFQDHITPEQRSWFGWRGEAWSSLPIDFDRGPVISTASATTSPITVLGPYGVGDPRQEEE